MWILVVGVAACGSGGSKREAYAVGAHVGGGSAFGPGPKCTYEVTPASAAELSPEKTVGTLVAPGELTTRCESGYTATFDIVAPTSAKITDVLGVGDKLGIGTKASFAGYPYAGNRELKTDGHFEVMWMFSPDCASSATTKIDTPAGGDSLRGSYHLDVTGKAPGTCTITAEVLGQKATKTITVR
jgi:hypothetical protein